MSGRDFLEFEGQQSVEWINLAHSKDNTEQNLTCRIKRAQDWNKR